MADHGQEVLLEHGQWTLALQDSNATMQFKMLAQWLADPARRIRPVVNGIAKYLPNRMSRRDKPAAALGPTSYLDGLRGFAALLVYCIHHQLWAHVGFDRIIENAFGFERRYYFAALPGIRTFFSGGHMAVAIFFVISGYVLSAKPLRLARQGEMIKLGDNLSSALFRRWLRLYIPVALTTFVWMLLNSLIKDLSNHKPEAKIGDEVIRWYNEFKAFTFVFREGGEPWFLYNFHAWTIPLEFKGSIVVYTSLMAFSRCTRTMRLWCSAGLVFYFLYIVDAWYLSCFTAGMLLSDLDQLAEEDQLPSFMRFFKPHTTWIFPVLFVAGIYLGGVPAFSADMHDLQTSPGWYYLSKLKPQAVFHYKNFYLFWAGVCIVAAVPRISRLRAFFESSFCQYLGRVSFALYLVHGPILWSIGDRVYAAVGMTKEQQVLTIPRWMNAFPLPRWGPALGLEINFIAAQLVLLPLTLWVARVVTVLVDDVSIRLARWLYAVAITETSGCCAATGSGRELPKDLA